MEWAKKHVDTMVVLGGILGSILWMNTKFTEFDHRLGVIEKDLAVIKTVMIMKNILPPELAKNNASEQVPPK